MCICNAFEWDTVKYAVCHLYFPYTHEPFGVCVYEENTSYKWHIPQHPTRKHCITTLSHAQIFGKFTGIYKNFRNASNPSLRNFYKKRFMSILENLWQSLETFGNLLWKISESFGNGSVFQHFYDFLKFLENLQKSSEVFRNRQKIWEMVHK